MNRLFGCVQWYEIPVLVLRWVSPRTFHQYVGVWQPSRLDDGLGIYAGFENAVILSWVDLMIGIDGLCWDANPPDYMYVFGAWVISVQLWLYFCMGGRVSAVRTRRLCQMPRDVVQRSALSLNIVCSLTLYVHVQAYVVLRTWFCNVLSYRVQSRVRSLSIVSSWALVAACQEGQIVLFVKWRR